MTRFIKTTAITALALSTAMPAFAATTYDLSSMTCGEYNALAPAERDAIAVAAVSELNNTSAGTIAPNNGEATATAPLTGAPASESPAGSTTTLAPNNGEETATSTVPAGDDMTRFAEEINILNLTCARSMDAMVMEAAAGMEGTR